VLQLPRWHAVLLLCLVLLLLLMACWCGPQLLRLLL
jgi:hypothetical protein